MEKKFLDFIKNNNLFKKGDRVIVACSGGADSVALLVLLNKFKKTIGLSLCVVHVNHGIRGDEAKRDEEYVRRLSQELGVECVVKSVDVPKFASENKKTLEQAARELRYEALRQVKNEMGADKIAVAHNISDQSETILMHLCRGAGVSGVVGMTPVCHDIVRPLLEIDKRELTSYLEHAGIHYELDGTNSDINYTRNFIRHKVIAELEKVYPAVNDNIYRFSKKIRQVDEFIRTSLPLHYVKNMGNEVLVLSQAKVQPSLILSRLVIYALEELNAKIDVEEKHIDLILELFDMQVGKKISLPNKVQAMRVQEGVLLEKNDYNENIIVAFNEKAEVRSKLGTIIVREETIMNKIDGVLYVDLDKIPSDAVWRHIQKGDKFTKFSGGTKSLAKYLIDKKIDANSRKKLLVVASGDEVLVVPGVEISNKLKITEKTKRIVSIKMVLDNEVR